jgi:hypothetical protein
MNDSPNGATPPGVPEGAMPVRMSKTIIYESFAYEINDLPQMDRRDVILTTPGGERVILPFHGDAAIRSSARRWRHHASRWQDRATCLRRSRNRERGVGYDRLVFDPCPGSMVVRRHAVRVIICDACSSLITPPCVDDDGYLYLWRTADGREGHVCGPVCGTVRRGRDLTERQDEARQGTAQA